MYKINCNGFVAFFVILLIISHLNSCGYKRRRNVTPNRNDVEIIDTHKLSRSRGEKIVVKMKEYGGVYHVPCRINGTEMEFIFDTGASDITMSLTEAKFLFKQGKLNEEDFMGSQQYQIADGSIHEGITVVLREVEIGGRILREVNATIVDNEAAPLLLGQSALAKFGKISIDYHRGEIIFE